MHGMGLQDEMTKDNRLIKQTVHKTYDTATGVLGKAKSKILIANPNDRTNKQKQTNQGSKTLGLA